MFSTPYPKPYIHFFFFPFFGRGPSPPLCVVGHFPPKPPPLLRDVRDDGRRDDGEEGRGRLCLFFPQPLLVPLRFERDHRTPFIRVTSTQYVFETTSTSKIGIFEKGKNNRRSHHHHAKKRVDADVSRPSWRCAG